MLKTMQREDVRIPGYATQGPEDARQTPVSMLVDARRLDQAVRRAQNALMTLQDRKGYWVFELEADSTIPAEYILMMHHMDEVDGPLQSKIAAYLRAKQGKGGGWPLYTGGEPDISCSVKAYYALKLAGDSVDAPHMKRARLAILALGGAAKCNVFTRIMLAQFGQIPWRGVPYMPVEIMLLPRWFPFHIHKVSYWSRTVMIPLCILCTTRARAKNPMGIGVRELFVTPPEHEKDYFPIRSGLNRMFLAFEKLASYTEPFIPAWMRRRALRRAEAWMVQRLNGEGGLGAIFPAMVNAYEALACLGYGAEHPLRKAAKKALQDLLVESASSAYCQPCTSPVWDTALSSLALQACQTAEAEAASLRALDWLKKRQLLDAAGDWQAHRPHLEGGGWPFQFDNDHYPDLDDTSAVAWSMYLARRKGYDEPIRRAANWIRGMQCRNGGFASFDVDNTYEYLNEMPFADHGALLDPPTSDVSARCAIALGVMAEKDPTYRSALHRCLAYLCQEQEANGSWYGRWGTNYIYGTWSVLAAMESLGLDMTDAMVCRAASWLVSVQRPDGGWGEDHDTYSDPGRAGKSHTSTAFQTAWAMLGLMAAGDRGSLALQRGAQYLIRRQQADGLWADDWFTAPGFPRVFYLKYHGYDKYFPLWALARYRSLSGNSTP